MCSRATHRTQAAAICIGALLSAYAYAQPAPVQTEWRRVGGFVHDGALAGPASGPVNRVWYSADGVKVGVETATGRRYETADLETWIATSASAPSPQPHATPINLPERGAIVRRPFGQNARLYAFGDFVYRSNDGGKNWENAVLFQNASILGGKIRDLAVSPNEIDEIIVAADTGVFRSTDAGLSWSSLNSFLPNLPATRILAVPADVHGARIALSDTRAADWPPGEKQNWVGVSDTAQANEAALRTALSSVLGTELTALTISGNFIYAGSRSGDLRVSSDSGASWRMYASTGGPIERIWVNATNANIALAVFGARPQNVSDAPVHALHTMNAGAVWDNITANLPDAPAHGVSADPATGAIYIASDRGVFLGYADLSTLGAAPAWIPLSGLPDAAALDARLDAQAHQLWVALDGLGVYAALAPHRKLDPKVVSAADLLSRAAAPGSLITVLGAQLDSAHIGGLTLPVLASNAEQSQIQVPFEANGASFTIAAATRSNGPFTFGPFALAAASPAIFIDRDGGPMLLDADSGLMLDASAPAHSGTRIQILATGLGRVTPAWPTGVAAPLDNPPAVAGIVHAYLDRTAIEVTRATLAPGYVGLYLIEVTIPKIVNYGPAELYVDVDGAPSNRVAVYIEP
ncbi:MAG: hypothetical protein ABL967_13745 [Bryobacteraceae bacterium]